MSRPSAIHPNALNGEGIKLINVKYKGVLILSRASIPVLNVKYQNGCGPCYRDWFWQERAFECAPTTSPGQCSGTTTPAATVCQHPGFDAGTFNGVSVEDKGTHLKLMSQTEAGWYRYIPVYELYPDGTIQTRMDATAVTHSCVQYTHNHHVYWRLDFDVAGSDCDYVDDLTAPPGAQRAAAERNYIDTSPLRRRWRVGSFASSYAVEVTRNSGDQAAGDAPLVSGDFPVADGWVLAYDANQLSDYQNLSTCAAGLDSFLVPPQNVNGADLVLWVRGAGYHEGELSMPTPTGCEMFGPTIRVISQPSQFHTLPPCRILDTRDAAGAYGGPALASGVDRNFVLAGQCGVPSTARAVAANLTVTQPSSQGHIQIAAATCQVPPSSVMNFTAGQTRANNATLLLGPMGDVVVRSVLTAGSVHFILDVTGYYE